MPGVQAPAAGLRRSEGWGVGSVAMSPADWKAFQQVLLQSRAAGLMYCVKQYCPAATYNNFLCHTHASSNTSCVIGRTSSMVRAYCRLGTDRMWMPSSWANAATAASAAGLSLAAVLDSLHPGRGHRSV